MCGGGGVLVSPCSIQTCLENKFRLLNFDIKCQIVEKGKPTPKLENLKVEVKSKDKKFTRSFSSTNYTTHNWMAGCSTLNKLFCWPCLLFSNASTVWNSRGYSDLNNLSTAITRHTKSGDHISAVLTLASFNKNTLHAGFNKQQKEDTRRHNEKVRQNRNILKRLIDTVCHLANQEIAFRGHNEKKESLNRGNYKETLKLLARYDSELEAHLRSNCAFKGTSCHIQNDLIHSIATVLLNEQSKEIREATFVSILLDESCDRAKHSQLSTVYRYCSRSGEVKEVFRGFSDVSNDRSASALFEHVKTNVNMLECGEKLVGQGYDGAAVMSGSINGLQTKVREMFPYALFIHCCAHTLNLVLSQTSKSISACRIFFDTLQGFASFFSVSSKRNNLLEKIMHRKFPQITVIRWNFKSKLVNTVYENRNELIYLFESICDPDLNITDNDFSGADIVMAKGFLSFLNEFHFNFLLNVFTVIFAHTDMLFQFLQNKGLELNACITRLEETQTFLQKNRNEGYDNLYYTLVNKLGPPSIRGRNQTPEGHYKALYCEIYDVIITQLDTRFQNIRNLKFTSLLDHRHFDKYVGRNENFPQEALESLNSTYGFFFDKIKLKTELSILYTSQTFKNKTVSEIYGCLSNELKNAFSEVSKLCELILTLPSTTVSVERSFSALNQIMDYLRTTMGQDRLSNLALLAIERAMLHELRERPDFYDLVITEFVKKDRRMELHFRS